MATRVCKGIPAQMVGWLSVVMLAALVNACGGGGGGDTGWLFPLWVPTDVKLADIDGDGRLDIIATAQLGVAMGQSEGRLEVRRQTASGVFARADAYVVGVYPWKLKVADIDGDGRLDLMLVDAATGSSSSGAVWMLRQDPASQGRFLPPQRLLQTTGTAYDFAVGDVNGDGVADLLLSSRSAGETGAALLLQDAAHRGNFLAPTAIAAPGNATAVAIGDLNGDGRNDLVMRVASTVVDGVATTVLGVLHGQADGTLGAWTELPSPAVGLNSEQLVIRDLNGDGTQDIVEHFHNCCVEYQARITSLLQASADASFNRVDTSLAAIQGRDGGVFNDVTGDSRVDFASVGFYPVVSPSTVLSEVNTLVQDAQGTFRLAQTLALPISASRIASGDLNNDGRPDLVVIGTDRQQLKLASLLQSAAGSGTFLTPQILD